MPPLRDRGDDVLRIAEHVLARLRTPRPVRLSLKAKARLLGYRWPGNVRELQNVLSVAAALAEEGVIGPEHLELPGESAPAAAFHQRVDAFCRNLIEQELAACGGNHAEAARRLGLSRQGLSYRIRRYRLG
jgi:DNA-binding NtrC family response regulator